MKLFNRIGDILTSPTKYFSRTIKERGVSEAFKFAIILGLFYAVVSAIVGLFTVDLKIKVAQVLLPELTKEAVVESAKFSIPGIILGTVFSILGMFVIAGILHLWIKLFGGKAPYEKTYQLFVYSSTPSFLFGWLPILGWFTWIYDLILLIKSTTIFHKLTTLKSTILYLVPVILIIILVALLTTFILLLGAAYFLSNPTV